MSGNTWNAGRKYLEFIDNGTGKLVLYFMVYLGQRMMSASRRNERFALFSLKNNQDGCMEKEAFTKPSRTSTMEPFW